MKNKKMKYMKKVILTIVAIIALAGYWTKFTFGPQNTARR